MGLVAPPGGSGLQTPGAGTPRPTRRQSSFGFGDDSQTTPTFLGGPGTVAPHADAHVDLRAAEARRSGRSSACARRCTGRASCAVARPRATPTSGASSRATPTTTRSRRSTPTRCAGRTSRRRRRRAVDAPPGSCRRRSSIPESRPRRPDEGRALRSRSVSSCARARSHEPAARQGLSHFLEHLLFKRTRRRTNGRDRPRDRPARRRRGRVHDQGVHRLLLPHARLPLRARRSISSRTSCSRRPSGAADVEVERGVILEEIGEANDNPEDLAHENFVRAFWRDHPLGAPILGTAETVGAIRTRRPRRPTTASRYAPAISSSPSRDAIGPRDAVRARSSGSSAGGAAGRRRRARRREAPRAPHPHVLVRPRPGLEQAHLCLGMAGQLRRRAARRFAAALLDIVLGGGMSSRLFQEVRERRGLVYTIGSSLNAYRLGGYETHLRRVRAEEPAARPRGDAARSSEVEARRGPAARARVGQGEPDGQPDARARVDRLAHVRRRRARSSTSAGSEPIEELIAPGRGRDARRDRRRGRRACSTAGVALGLGRRQRRPAGSDALGSRRRGVVAAVASEPAFDPCASPEVAAYVRGLAGEGLETRVHPADEMYRFELAAPHRDAGRRRRALLRDGPPDLRGRRGGRRAGASGASAASRRSSTSRAAIGRTTRFLVRVAPGAADHGRRDRSAGGPVSGGDLRRRAASCAGPRSREPSGARGRSTSSSPSSFFSHLPAGPLRGVARAAVRRSSRRAAS